MVESTENKVVFKVGSERIFPFHLAFFEKADIHCYVSINDAVRELTAEDFSVENKSDYSEGANITLNISVDPESVLTIVRELKMVQQLSLPENGRLPSKPMENQFDRIVMMVQQLKEELGRTLVLQHGAMIDPGKLFDVLMESSDQAVRSADEAKESASNAKESADAAAKELANYLPLSGGEMTGNIYLPPERGLAANHKKDVFIVAGNGWKGNGHIVLRGQESAYNPGGVSISVGDGVSNKDLHLFTDGKMTWDGKEAEIVSSKSKGSNWYIKYSSGLIIQGIYVGGNSNTNNQTVTLPVAMTTTNYAVQILGSTDTLAYEEESAYLVSRNTTSIVIRRNYHTKGSSILIIGF